MVDTIVDFLRRRSRPKPAESPVEKLDLYHQEIKKRVLSTGYGPGLFSFLTEDEIVQYVTSIPDAVRREVQLHKEYKLRTKPEGWKTTDPRQHDPTNFRYIAHAIINGRNDYVKSLRGERPDPDRRRPGHDLEGFLTRSMTSTTLIDEIHRGTYCEGQVSHGFILEVPEENILAIHAYDMGKPWDITDRSLFEQRHRKDIEMRKNTSSAQAFLDKGVSPHYNEVIIDSIGPTGKRIQISAIFLKTHPILGIPQYELDRRISRTVQEEVERSRLEGWSEQALLNHNPGYREAVRQSATYERKYQEARDLASLLSVPIIHIPSPISLDHYKYIVPDIVVPANQD